MNIGIKIVERKPIVEGSPRLICGNSGDTITFTFDSEWSNYTAKVARFVYVKNGVVESQEVLFNGNVAEIPVLSNITEVFIGVYTGDLRTTTPVTIPCDFSILCKGGEPVDPTPDIYAQILDALNAKLILEGNASSATKLETPRTIQVDLANSNGVSFDGTEDVTPGVTGVLPKEHGGTGTPTPELIFAPHAVKRVNGSAVAVNDSSNSPLANLKLFGKTTQDETTLDSSSVGDSGSYEVGVYGKNALEIIATTQTVDGVTFTVNADKSITAKGTATKNVYLNLSKIEKNFLNSGYILRGGVSGDNFYMSIYDDVTQISDVVDWYGTGAKLNKEGLYGWVRLFVGNGTTIDKTFYPMLYHESVTDTTYEPYKAKQTFTNTDTLRGIGDIADEKNFARGVKIQRMNEVELDGSDDEYWVKSIYVLAGGNRFDFASSLIPQAKNITCICDGFQATPTANEGTDTCWCNHTVPNTFEFRIITNRVSTVAELKAMLQANPIKVVYPMITPIETPLTEQELNAYRHLMTNKGNTTILSEANLEVDYYTDTLSGEALGNIHSQVHNDYLKLQQAIISLVGGNTL